MKKFRLTNPIEQPIPNDKNLLYLSNALSKYQWLFLLIWTALIGLLFFFIGRFAGQRNVEPAKRNPYLPKDESMDVDPPLSSSENNNSSTT